MPEFVWVFSFKESVSLPVKSASTGTKEFTSYQDIKTSQERFVFVGLFKSKTSILKYHRTYHNKDKTNTTKYSLDSHTLKGLNLNNKPHMRKTKKDNKVTRKIFSNKSISGIQNQRKNQAKTDMIKNQK
jgi:hypothetical protein